jgi:hypothetical protein
LQEVELESVRVREDKRVKELVQQLEQEAKARAKCESELEIQRQERDAGVRLEAHRL